MQALTATGGTGPYSWSITAGALPPGLSLVTNQAAFPPSFPVGTTGGIIGVATTVTIPANFTLTVTDSLNATFSLPCTMSIIPLAITATGQLFEGTVNVPYSYTPPISGATGGVTWSLNPNNLPPGLSLNPATGEIVGTPTTAGTFGFGLSATDSVGSVGRFLTIVVSAVGFSGSANLGNVNQGSTVNTTVTAAGGAAPFSFTASNLPPGLSMSAGGTITGTATGGSGTYRIQVTVTDNNGARYTRNYAINVIATPSLPNLSYGNPSEDASLGESRVYGFNANGGKAPYTWSITGVLPGGMRLRTTNLPSYMGPNDAVIDGAPTELNPAGFTINLTDSSTPPVTVSQPFTISVKAMSHGYPANPTRGTAFSYFMRPIGGAAPYTWTIIQGAPPAGVTLDANGVFSGTPTENGTFTVLVNMTGGGISIKRYLNFNVQSPTSPSISISGQLALSDAVVNSPYSWQFNGCCAPAGVTYSLTGAPPAGLTFTPQGLLSGTPTAVGNYNLEVRATDNGNGANFGVQFFTLRVSPLQPNTPTPNGTAGSPYTTTFTATGGTGALNWTLGPGSQLPPGLTFASNGQLSGTPITPGSFNLNYIVTDSLGKSFNGYFGVQVYAAGSFAPPNISVGPDFGPGWTQGEIQYALTATGGNGTYVWSLAGGTLPIGLAIRTDTPSFFPAGTAAGLIGLAVTPGNYAFTLAVTSAGQTSYQFCTWRISPLILKDAAGPPLGFLGVPYSYTFTALNPAGTIKFTATSALPPGLTLSDSGVLSGTPTVAGAANFSFTYSDGVDTNSRGFTFNTSRVRFTNSGVLPNVSQGGAYNTTLIGAGGTGPYTFAAQNSIPGGLTLSAAGVLSGTITAPVGRSSFQVKVTDANSAFYTKTFSIDVIGVPPLLPSINLNDVVYRTASVGMYFTRIVSVVNGGTAPFTWTVTGLPPGVSARLSDASARTDLTPGDVEIWGTPTAAGSYSVQYTVTDADGVSATTSYPFLVSVLVVDGGDYLPNGTVGVAYGKTLRVLGGTAPYSVTQANTLFNPLPAGLALNAGAVTGNPQENGGFAPVLAFTDLAGHEVQTVNYLTIFGAGGSSININQYFNLGNAVANTAISVQLSACCTASNLYTWTKTGGTLPPGTSLSTAGLLSGTPTTPGLYSFLVHAVDQNNAANVGLKQFVLNVTPIAVSSPYNLPFGTLTAPYSYQILTSGGTGAMTYSLGAGGTLPSGILLNPSTGLLSGTPTATGNFTFTVVMADSGGHNTFAYFSLAIYPANGGPAVAITTAPVLGPFSIGVIQQALVASGGTGTYTWSVTAGSLPPGLSLRTDKPSSFSASASAGIIGVATTPQAASYSFTLTATSGTQSASVAFTMKITGLVSRENTAFRLPDAFVGTPYTYNLGAFGNAGGVSWASPVNLPPGLTLSNTGVLSGSPTTNGVYNFSFTINDGVDTVSAAASLNITKVQITSPGLLPNATQGTSYTTTVTASGGTGPYSFSVSSLPSGLSINATSGVISGTVTAGPGRFAFNLTATDSTSASYTRNSTITVIGVPPSLPQISPYGNLDDCSIGITCGRALGVVNGGTAPFTWNISNLPPGMSFRSGSGVSNNSVNPVDVELFGPPLATGTFNITATVTDAAGKSATQTYPLRVSALYVDGSDYLPGGTRGVAYSKLLRVLGGSPALGSPMYTTQMPLGVLPAGVTLSGMLASGTPAENGTFNPQFTFTDTASRTLRITESFGIGAGSSTISAFQYMFANTGSYNDVLGVYTVGASVSFQLNACCSPNAFAWSKVNGTLPPGVSLSTGGFLSGTATTAGTYVFGIQVSDSGNAANFGLRQYTIIVTPLNITTASALAYGNVGTPYSAQLAASALAAFSVMPGYYLPPGLSISATGLISGTPTSTGLYSFYILASDGANHAYTKSFTVSIFGAGEYPPLFLGTGPNVGPNAPGPHNYLLSASGGKPPYHYSFTPGAPAVPNWRVQDGGQLPSSFTLSSLNGALMGVTTVPRTSPTSLRVTDDNGSVYDRAITIIETSLTILNPANPPAAQLDTPYSYAFVGAGGTGTYSFSITGLPAGLSMNSQGIVSGTPTASGSFGYTISITDTGGTTIALGQTLTVNAFAITTGQVLPPGTINVNYSQTLLAPNCGSNCTWTVVSGSLPGGLALSSAGVLSGRPTGFYSNSFTVQASGSNGTVQRLFAILVPFGTPQPLFISEAPNLSDFTVGSGYTNALLVQGGTAPYTWSLAPGSNLPPGISLKSPGETFGFNFQPGFTYLWGRALQTGAYTFTLQVTDGASNTATQTFTWNIVPFNFNMGTFPVNGTAGTYGGATPTPTYGLPYSQQLLVLGGTGNYTSWVPITPLPAGLVLNPASGLVTGTPAVTGSISSVVQLTDDGGNTIQQSITFNIVSPTGTTVSFGAGPILSSFSTTPTFNLNPSGGTGPYTITALDPLPPGCAIVTGNSLLTTSPGAYNLQCVTIATGTYTFALKATDSLGNFGVRAMSITFTPQALFSPTGLPNGSVGTPYSQPLLTFDNTGTVNWTIAPGSALPPGLTLTGNTIAGTPTAANSYSFALIATDSVTALPVTFTFTLVISTINITNPPVLPILPAPAVPVNYQFTATGGGAVKTWTANGLPNGLSLSSSGLLTGTIPDNNSLFTFNITITVTDGASTFTKRFTLFLNAQTVLSFTQGGTVLADARVGVNYSVGLNPSGGTPPYTWTLAPGSVLPPGMDLYSGNLVPSGSAPGTVILAGLPSTAGQYSFDLIATDAASATIRRTFTWNVSPAVLPAGNLPNATSNTPYSRQLIALGGTAPYTFTYSQLGLNTPMFPAGVSASPSGLISGTPTSTGTYQFYAIVTDSASHHYQLNYSLTVTNASGLSITSPPIFGSTVGKGLDTNLFASGNSTYTWSLLSGALPPGWALAPWGELSGNATIPGTFTYTVRATDNTNAANFADRQYTAQISPMQVDIPGDTLPPITIGVPYSYTYKVVGGTAPYTFTTSPLSPLPLGLTLSPSGVLSGTPTQAGRLNVAFTFLLSDSAGNFGYASSGPITVREPGQVLPLVGSGGGAPDASAGVAYGVSTMGAVGRGGLDPISYAVAPGSTLPPGMTILSSSNGVAAWLGGIPTTPGTYTTSFVATDAAAQTVALQATFVVSPISASPKVLANGVVGSLYSQQVTALGGTAPYSIKLEGGSDLPPGLTLHPSGLLLGVPLFEGYYEIAVKVTDSRHPQPHRHRVLSDRYRSRRHGPGHRHPAGRRGANQLRAYRARTIARAHRHHRHQRDHSVQCHGPRYPQCNAVPHLGHGPGDPHAEYRPHGLGRRHLRRCHRRRCPAGHQRLHRHSSCLDSDRPAAVYLYPESHRQRHRRGRWFRQLQRFHRFAVLLERHHGRSIYHRKPGHRLRHRTGHRPVHPHVQPWAQLASGRHLGAGSDLQHHPVRLQLCPGHQPHRHHRHLCRRRGGG